MSDAIISATPSTLPIVSDIPSQPQSLASDDKKVNNTNSSDISNLPGISNIFKTTISLPPMSVDLGNASQDEKNYMVNGLGTHPFVWYNGYQISYQDVKRLELYSEDNVPKIKLVFKDTANIIKNKGFPLDDTRVRIFLNSRSKNLRSIYMEFKILDFKHLGETKYSLVGIISVNSLFTRIYQSFPNKTSNQALQKFCQVAGLGFNSNMEDSSDIMTWINPAKTGLEFMNDMILNSYTSDTSYTTGFVDFYYNFNYINVEKEFLRDNSNDKGIDTGGINQSSLGKDTSESILPLVLTTDRSVKDSSLFIGKSRVVNSSTSISIQKGYRQTIKSYDVGDKEYLSFEVDSITTNDGKSIILKGAPKDSTFYNDNRTVMWSGKIDTDNVHKNYNYAITQNRQNLDDLGKIYCELELPNPNFNLYKYLKIKILFIEGSQTPSSQEIYLVRLTGDWIITDIRFIYSSGSIKQIVNAVKRELGLANDEMSQSA